MSFLKLQCVTCGNSKIKEQSLLGTEQVTFFECGHYESHVIVDQQSDIDLTSSSDGRSLYKFQEDGVRFAIASNIRCLIADEMRLGKTVQALKTIKSRPADCVPFTIFCKSSLKLQWMKEVIRWCGFDYLPQILSESKDKMHPGFSGYIFSLDLLRRFNGELTEQFSQIGVKLIIIDETQLIKNHQSARAKAVRALCKGQEHIMGLSGTPIKNRASEYFSILNILKPEMFPVYEHFIWRECRLNLEGKVTGLRYPEEFHEKTKHFIIRRERAEVMPDMPKIARDTRFCELGEKVTRAYERQLEELTDAMDNCSDSEHMSFGESSNILGMMARLRHITGLAKVQPTIDFVEEFLTTTERKLVVFCHHKDVHQLILNGLNNACEILAIKQPISLVSGLDSTESNRLAQQFLSDERQRLVVASTLAFGEGLTLYPCLDCVIVERQWNPANEEQAECRFPHVDAVGEVVQSTYIVATGTIDEYLTEIVERKRQIVAQTLNGDSEAITWNQTEIMRELAQRLAQSHREKWRLQ